MFSRRRRDQSLERPANASEAPSEQWLYDFTLGAHFGLSALMALADEDVSQQIVECQQIAVERCLGHLSARGAYGRLGARTLDSRGLRAQVIQHTSSAEGHPYLHSHVLVSTHVELLDGMLAPLERGALENVWIAAQVDYLASLENEAEKRVGVRFEDRGNDRAVVGVDRSLETLWLPSRCHQGITQQVAQWRS